MYPPRPIGTADLCISIIDARGRQHRRARPPEAVVRDAIARLSAARQGFGELVVDHIAVVMFAKTQSDFVAPGVKAFVTDFDDVAESGHLLACKLVWAATAIRLAHNRLTYKRTIETDVIGQAARLSQLRFLQQFPEWMPWATAMGLTDLIAE